MDCPLRPKAVPLAENTVLWFEFLLDPHLITKHLNKNDPEPSALELMQQFISMTPDNTPVQPQTPSMQFDLTGAEHEQMPIPIPGPGPVPVPVVIPPPPINNGGNGVTNNESLTSTKKQLALKILTLKVATFLKWNLDLFEKHLPLAKQFHLLKDLCSISLGKVVSIPFPPDFDVTPTGDGNEKAARFALTFYHRWVLRLHVVKDLILKTRQNYGPMEQIHHYFPPDIPAQPSVDYLQELCSSTEPFFVFTYETFAPLHPNSENTEQNYAAMIQISAAELRTQINYDLVNFYLYTKQYILAREAVNHCRTNLVEMKREYQFNPLGSKEYVFSHVNEEDLEGILLACGESAQATTLMERFNVAKLTNFKDIVEILKMDNQAKEIPLVNRRIVELDIEACLSQGILPETSRSVEMQVAALNLVRSVIETDDIFAGVEYFEKYNDPAAFSTILDCVRDVLSSASLKEQEKIKAFLVDYIVRQPNGLQIMVPVRSLNLFTEEEMSDLTQQLMEEDLPMPALAMLNEWKINSKYPRLEIGCMEKQLITCTNANTVRKLLGKLASTNPTKPLWTVNPSWELPDPVKNVVLTMSRGFLQDFAFVLLGKARELAAKHDYVNAVSLLSVLKSETQRQELSHASNVAKLGKLINWEILDIQIRQCLHEWHKKNLDLQNLGNRCKQCLAALQNNDNVIPRIEIIDNCAIMLLNLNDWNAVMVLDKRLPQLEIHLAFAATFLDMEKMKGTKKPCRDAWDIVLSIFQNNSKKSSGSGSGSSRSSPSLAPTPPLQFFLERVRHQTVFSLAISMLGKIHNLLKDDPNHDLNGEYMQIWPTSISNPLGYSIRSVCETLSWLLTEALKYYPQTIVWLKMKGDLELAIGNNEAAMRCYVNALITGTDYCSMPLQRNVADDYVIRKMIRCSSNLGCHMQATILCQFLEEIDYGIVFKNLTERCANFTDAMDAYYNCIWDTTLLEFIINLHGKKGEHMRKLEAINIMGNLELNANNNDEIRREAAAVRKARFLRALAKQYLI